MANPTDTTPSPGLLMGEAVEDWTGDAVFYEYSTAVDPMAAGAIAPVPARRFAPEPGGEGRSRLVPLDLSAELGVAYPATSPALLAAFLVLLPDDPLPTAGDCTSELYYCLSGRGCSEVERSASPGHPGRIDWGPGDFITLPAGCSTIHRATGGEALLYRVTDAPLLSYLGVAPAECRFEPTRFDGVTARQRLAEVAGDPRSSGRNRISVLLGNTATPQTLTVTHTLWAMLGVLPAGRVQRPHRHQSVALDLITDCAPGCYSIMGSSLGADGTIADPERIDWEPGGAFVTPPGLWHSHHNESGRAAYLVPIQDAGLHTYLRTLDIRFAPPDD
ncbi:MAG: cupin [Acidimicrobiales bacterium]